MNEAERPLHRARVALLLGVTLGVSLLGAALPGGGVSAAAVAPMSVVVPAITPCAEINKRKIIFTRTSIGIQGAVTTKNFREGQWAISLLDPMHRIAATYKPKRLVAITWRGVISPKGGYLLRPEAAAALSLLFADAKLSGFSLTIRSAYRSYATQKRTFAYWVSKSGLQLARRYSAVPGHSEHQLGTTVDLGSLTGIAWSSPRFPTTATALWIEANAYRFGFVRSYPAGPTKILESCYGSEPWHWRYVGTALSYEIACSAQVPRIFLWSRQNDGGRVIGPTCDTLTPPDGYVLPSPSVEPPASETPSGDPTSAPSEAPSEAPTEAPMESPLTTDPSASP